MIHSLLWSGLFTIMSSWLTNKLAIYFGHKYGLLDIPTSRRRHKLPVPIIGGLALMAGWCLGIFSFALQQPEWFASSQTSIFVFAFAIGSLVILGLVDDLRGLRPYVKLSVEFVLAAIVLAYDPKINELIAHWHQQVGFIIWPLAALWIVGISNAINLVDGLDGLAGGMSLLVASSLLALSTWIGYNESVIVALAMLIPALISFLRLNWHPAKLFLGDNGSLPLGFILACSPLASRPVGPSWVLIASVILMLGYPMLDMALAVARRKKSKLPLFKADRSHLHYRLIRMGLSVRETASLLLMLGVYLQIAALAVNFFSTFFAILGICMAALSIFTFLFLVTAVERWQQGVVFNHLQGGPKLAKSRSWQKRTVMQIDLTPLVNTNTVRNPEEIQRSFMALEFLLQKMSRDDEPVLLRGTTVSVIFREVIEDKEMEKIIYHRYHEKICDFLALFNIDCSLSNLPITFEEQHLTGQELFNIDSQDSESARKVTAA